MQWDGSWETGQSQPQSGRRAWRLNGRAARTRVRA